MQRVRLLGELGERFGAEFTYYNLRRPADAIKLLCINRPDFKDYLLKSEENGIAFKVIQSDVEMDYEDLLLPIGQQTLVIVPVVTGSGSDFGRILAGVGLVAFAILTAGAGAAVLGIAGAGAGIFGSSFTLGIVAANAIAGIGVSLAITGVAGLLSPQPRIPALTADRFGSGSRNRTGGPTNVTRGLDGVQSYAYNGAANTIGVGATVPLVYGRVLIGSHLLRSKVEVADESDPPLNSIKKSGPDTFLIGGEKITTTFSDVSGAVVKRVYPDKTEFSSEGSFSKRTNVVNTPTPLPAKPNTTSARARTSNINNQVRPLSGEAGISKTSNTQPTAPAVSAATVRNRIQTVTTPAVSNAITNILATGTNSSTGSLTIARLNSYRTNFNVAFNLSNGLFNYAGGAGTTLVDAFITYEIAAYHNTIAQDKLIAIDQATIQGLLLPTQDNITWMHKMELPTLDSGNVVVQVKILDTDAYTSGLNGSAPINLNLLAIGYGLN